MVNISVVYGCRSGYFSSASAEEKVSFFTFPLEKPDLLSKWIKFVNRSNWTPTKYSVICIKHFEDKFIFHDKENKKAELEPQSSSNNSV